MSETKGELRFSDSEKALLRQRYAKLTDVEFDAFLCAAQRYQLNPLANQIYARLQPQTDRNPRSVTYTTQIDGYRLIADRTGAYAGNDDPQYDDEKHPKRATVTVYKIVGGVRCGFQASARWDQYFPGPKQGFMWNKMPHLMLGKCAEALALRKAFPAALSGIYTAEEMHQADKEDSDRDEAEQEEPAHAPPAPQPPPPPPKPAPPQPPAPPSAAAPRSPLEKIQDAIHSKKTAGELNKWLMDTQQARPVADAVDSWGDVIDVCYEYLNTMKWSDAQKKSVASMLATINTQIEAAQMNAALAAAAQPDEVHA